MVPKDFRKERCISAGWFTLVVGILWEIVAVYTVGVYNCAWSFIGIHDDVTVWNMLYVTYYMGSCSGESAASDIGFAFTPPSKPAISLQIWMWIYIIVTAVWIAASVMLIVAATREVRGHKGALLYYPWLCSTILLTFLDLSSTIYYLVDLFQSLDVEGYATLTGATNWSTLTNGELSDGIISWLPSLFITLICCRFLVIWVMNCFCIFNIYKASRTVFLYKTKYLQSEVEPQSTHVISTPQSHGKDNIESWPGQSPPRASLWQPEDSITKEDALQHSQEHSQPRYIEDTFGIPIEEVDPLDPREILYSDSEGYIPRTPYQLGRVFDYNPQTRQEGAPPLASGVQVPPELNSAVPFSYMAGDQPQQLKRNLSRSNSRQEYPHIPRPDYTIADRRSASLEYIPHRFKVPQPKGFVPSQSSFNDSLPSSSRSPTSPRKLAPAPPHKPRPYPKTSKPTEEPTTPPYLVQPPQQNMPAQSPTYYTRQSSQNSNFNINKLY